MGLLLASGSDYEGAWLWDVKTGKAVLGLPVRNGVTSVVFSPDGSLLAFGMNTGNTAELWDVGTGQLIATLLGHTIQVTSLAFSPDGFLLASGGFEGVIRLWAIPSAQTSPTVTQTP